MKNAEDKKIKYECMVKSKKFTGKPIQNGEEVVFDLSSIEGSDCSIEISKNIDLFLIGKNGKIKIDELENNIAATISNGMINFNAKESVDYKYDTSVVNGKADNGESSQNENAYIVKLKLTNGMINL